MCSDVENGSPMYCSAQSQSDAFKMAKWEFVNVLVCSVIGKSGVRAEVRFCSGPCCDARFVVRVEAKEYSINNCAFLKADLLWYAKDRLSLPETLLLAESIVEKQEPTQPETQPESKAPSPVSWTVAFDPGVPEEIPAHWLDSPAAGV